MFLRQQTDEELAPFGTLADVTRQARKPLATFLGDPRLACQTDNLTLRMLLVPHPLIPDAHFINPMHTKRLVREALARLRGFDFVDVVENSDLEHRLQRWLGCSFSHDRHNETNAIVEQFRVPLHRELTPEGHELLDARSRLDFRLWAQIVAQCLPDREVFKLREQTIMVNVARYSILMA